jgi:hypothetical protein
VGKRRLKAAFLGGDRGDASETGAVDRQCRPLLTIQRILQLADAYHARTGEWPTRDSSWLPGDRELTWRRVDNALRYRLRGISVRSSLARLLARERGVRNVQDLPELTKARILSWADRHKRRTGRWPTENSGPIANAPGEVWANINAALMQGLRGLPGGSSLFLRGQVQRGWAGPGDGWASPPLHRDSDE